MNQMPEQKRKNVDIRSSARSFFLASFSCGVGAFAGTLNIASPIYPIQTHNFVANLFALAAYIFLVFFLIAIFTWLILGEKKENG